MPASVLDASALLALLQDEPGAEAAAGAIGEDAAISAVNVAEVLSKLAEAGADPALAMARIEALDEALVVYPLERGDLVEIARLRPLTRERGLSLGDRAALALAGRLQLPVLTTDQAWVGLSGIGTEVVQIR